MWAGKAMGAMQKDLPDFCKNDNPEKDLEHYLPKE